MMQSEVSTVDGLLDDQQNISVERYRMVCTQTVWLCCILFWIFTLPQLFIGYELPSTMGLILSVAVFVFYPLFWLLHPVKVETRSLAAARRRSVLTSWVWGVFYAMSALSMAAVTFGSNLWYGTPVSFEGPYQWDSVISRFYVPLLTMFIPIAVGRFASLLPRYRMEE